MLKSEIIYRKYLVYCKCYILALFKHFSLMTPLLAVLWEDLKKNIIVKYLVHNIPLTRLSGKNLVAQQLRICL